VAKKAAFFFRLAVSMVLMRSSYKSRTLGSWPNFSRVKKRIHRVCAKRGGGQGIKGPVSPLDNIEL